MIGLEPNKRNRALLKLLYVAGLRVSEVTQLQWFSLQPRDVGGQVLVYGKGGKTRAIKLPASLWQELQSMRGDAAIGEPVFTSRKNKGHLKEMQVNRIVKAAAKRVPGLEEAVADTVSPHWLRHAHTSQWIGALRFTWSRKRWVMQTLLRLGATFTRDLLIALVCT